MVKAGLRLAQYEGGPKWMGFGQSCADLGPVLERLGWILGGLAVLDSFGRFVSTSSAVLDYCGNVRFFKNMCKEISQWVKSASPR